MQSKLRSRDFEAAYYEEHKAAGLDYLGHGYWQQSYARMVADATFQESYERPVVFDAGCACGSILKGFKDTGIFARVHGMDLSAHMVGLGRAHFGFSESEMMVGSIERTSLPDACATLVHSAHVLEHIPAAIAESVVPELARILRPGGRAFLCMPAVRHGETSSQYQRDPTHVNIQPVAYWTRLFQGSGLLFDVEAYNRFVRSPAGPSKGEQRSFFEAYPRWSVWTLMKA